MSAKVISFSDAKARARGDSETKDSEASESETLDGAEQLREAMKKNRANEARVKADRAKANKSVKKSYRLDRGGR